MGSEAGRGLIRIAANYGRLFATLCLGLAAVRLELRALGDHAVGLIALLGSAIGIGAMLQEIVRASMIRELGEAFHSGNDHRFRAVYNSALLICAGVGGVTLLLFGVLILLLPLFDIPPDMLWAARWFTLAMGLQSCFVIVMAPPFNMYMVSERFVAYNVWTVVEKSSQAVAAGLLILMAVTSSSRGLILLGTMSTSLFVLALFLASAWIARVDRRLVPRPALASREAARSILRVSGWNVATVTANNLHIRVDNIIMNLAFGVIGNLVFGLAVQLTSYARMIATGVTTGLDAVAARFSSSKGAEALRPLTEQSTRLNGMVTFPAAMFVFVLARPILEVWVGPRLEDPASTIPPSVVLIRVLMPGIALRAISDGWARILYGAGHIRRYAPLVLLGGLCNPLLVGLLLLILPGETLHEGMGYVAPALGFSIIVTIVHFIAMPWIGAPLLGMRYAEMFTPLSRSLLLSLVCSPILWLALDQVPDWNLLWLLAAMGAYGGVYGLLATMFLFDPRERARIRTTLFRRPRGASGSDSQVREEPMN